MLLATARPDRAAFLVESAAEDDVLELARGIVDAQPGVRIGVGRPARGRALSRSLVEARAAIDSVAAPVAGEFSHDAYTEALAGVRVSRGEAG